MTKKEYNDRYRATHRKEILERKRIYRINNRKLLCAKQKVYAKHHKKETAVWYKKYLVAHKTKLRAYQKNWRELNAAALREKRKAERPIARILARKRYHEIIKADPAKHTLKKLRGRLWMALRNARANKAYSTHTLVGCTIPALLLHLESLFQPGMTWSNRSEWHIDHKHPCASFDLTDPGQQLQCFHYTNLQPLWKADNLAKGKKFPEAIAA